MTHPDTNRGTIVFQRLSENDFDGLLGTEKQPKISDEEWVQYQLYFKEWLFQRRDAVSRRTGSLAKNIVLLDMGGLSQKHLGNKRYKKLMTSPAIKTADDMYPQALGTIVIINLPGALAWIFNKVPMRKPAHASHAPTRWHACEHPKKIAGGQAARATQGAGQDPGGGVQLQGAGGVRQTGNCPGARAGRSGWRHARVATHPRREVLERRRARCTDREFWLESLPPVR